MSDILDDYDFVPSSSSGSNLRSLFDDSSNFENNTLIYTAPKQPRNLDELEDKDERSTKAIQTGLTSSSSIACAKIVNTWTLVEGKYKLIGKCGFAIIKGASHNEVILYKERRDVLMRAQIHETFQVFSKKNNFLTFYDDNKMNWLVNFHNTEDCLLVFEIFGTLGVKIVEEKSNITKESKRSDIVIENDEGNKARADILTRIAKMGQSILPINDKLTDTEEESTIESVTENRNEKEDRIAVAAAQPPSIQNAQTLVLTNQLPINYDPMNMLLSENRTQNIEMRLNMAQISEKLNAITEMIANKTEKAAKPENLEATLKSRIKVLELQNENFSRELIRLKGEACTKCTNYQEQIDTLSKTINQQSQQLEEMNEKIQIEETKWEKEVSSLKETISNMNQRKDNFPTILKEEMNVLYSKIIQNSSSDITPIVAQNIKQATLNIIQRTQEP